MPSGGFVGASGSGIQPYVMLMALSLHTVCAGAAYGMQSDGRKQLSLLIAVIAHMPLAAFSLGASIVAAGMRGCRVVKLVATFALMFSVGLLLGWSLIHAMPANQLERISAMAMAFTSGTFLYIAVVAILPKELEGAPQLHKLAKLFLMGCGFGAMACVKLLPSGD